MLKVNDKFPRGDGPLCSVLIPTRGRPEFLIRAVDSLFSLSWSKSLEFIFRIDDDDLETKVALDRLKKVLPIKVIEGPRGAGYRDIHKHLNEMAKISTGTWIFFLSDDSRMRTENWDLFLEQCAVRDEFGTGFVSVGCADGIWAFIPAVIGRPTSNEFVILHRRVWEVLGHISPTPHADNWLCTILLLIQRASVCNIDILHDHADAGEDQVSNERRVACQASMHDLGSVEMNRRKLADAKKLLDYIERERGANAVEWLGKPGGDGWYWWRGRKSQPKQHAMMMGGKAHLFPDGAGVVVKSVEEVGGEWQVRE